MKKLLFALLLLTSPVSFAQEAKGVIEEIQICILGRTKSVDWSKLLQFKVDGKWFNAWTDYYGSTQDFDDNLSNSLIFMAYSQRLPIHIKATQPWGNKAKKCGVTNGATFHNGAGDFIRIRR